MAGYKETPRQKMIGMMYLVLTALLALNVSKDILEAFVVVNESLVVTNENFEKKVNLTYEKFKLQYDMFPNKVKPAYDKALKAKKYSDDLVAYIEGLKSEVVSRVEGVTNDEAQKMGLREVQKRDNYDIPTNFFIGDSQDGSAGKARELKTKIEQFKKDMKSLVKVPAALKLGLSTEDTDNKIEGHVNWEMKNFYHLILAGVVTNLNRMITEVRNAEIDVSTTLYNEISAEDFKFDQINAKVVAKSSYVLVGNEYLADIFVAAYDSKTTPEVVVGSNVDTVNLRMIGDSTLIEGVEGVCQYKTTAAGVGEKKYGGIIKVKTNSGEVKKYFFKSSYTVGTPSATVSADKMNVFYIGVDNPVTISVPGVANDAVRASISSGTLVSKGAGKYTVTVTSAAARTTISVTATVGGRTTSMGTAEFRIKRVPDPIAMIANASGGNVSKSLLAAANGIIPQMKDFDFELYFTVLSFTMTMNVGGDLIEYKATGNKLTPTMVTKIQGARSGSKIYFEDIKAKGPDGVVRTLAPINIKLAS